MGLKEDIFADLDKVAPGRVEKNAPITGHNSQRDTAADDRLKLLIERIERLEEEKKGIADDIRDVYMEAKAVGYDPKIMRIITRLRKMKPDDRSEQEMLIETYATALGMQGVLPL